MALECLLRANPGLLIRGVSPPAPIDPPLITRTYDVHYSDGDQILWRPDLVRPISPEQDLLEAHVTFTTDEFGFRNDPPIPAHVDAVVLGRSISLGAQQSRPWPQIYSAQNGLSVWNLSEPGSGMEIKTNYLKRYALSRNPRWVIVEIQPAIDIITAEPGPDLLISELIVPVLQHFLKPLFPPGGNQQNQPILPISLDLPGRTLPLTCCLHYLEAQTVDAETIAASAQWADFKRDLDQIISATAQQGGCIALLYAPSKAELYFPLASQPAQLNPLSSTLRPLRLNENKRLVTDPQGTADAAVLSSNAAAGRDLLAAYALEQNLAFIDPSPAMTASILNGHDPFMVYDSHWNELGHQLVAQAVSQTLQFSPCP